MLNVEDLEQMRHDKLIVQHVKTGTFYKIEGVAEHTEEPGVKFVIYRECRGQSNDPSKLYARPAKMFCDGRFTTDFKF